MRMCAAYIVLEAEASDISLRLRPLSERSLSSCHPERLLSGAKDLAFVFAFELETRNLKLTADDCG